MGLELRVAGREFRAEAALFDKDGTIIDLHGPWTVWGEAVIDELVTRHPSLSAPALRGAIGLADGRVLPDSALAGGTVEVLNHTLSRELADLAVVRADEEVARAIERVDARIDIEAHVAALPGAVEAVERCRVATGSVGVVTADTTARARAHLRRVGLGDAVRVVVGADQVDHGKPDPSAVHVACAQLGVAPERVVFFGDSAHDALAAERAGVPVCVLVRTDAPNDALDSAVWAAAWSEVAVEKVRVRERDR
ncbi:HAD family hydrolase [Egibacter rhizosphaerae]|uniref:HAD family hydrolase n=1 Tax=Egibacter rhizosphaerae TaxID=1670831 RepID=A0A411YE65_9ACTN|nr:HAD family hydrolase [Egibacter rhizosphaerae]QBI19544.1 HAD family hydrolase [Egibacter rhizosphaerae]